MYRVLSKFADLKDYNHIYNVGDIYPREGMLPTPERVEELSSRKNRLRIPLIEKVDEEAKAEDKAVRKRKKKAE